MKKIIILIAVVLFSVNVYADSIPGFLELDASVMKWEGSNEIKKTFGSVNIDVVYGFQHDFFQPYLCGNFNSYFHWMGTESYSPINTYSYGIGLRLFKYFYAEYSIKKTNYLNYRTFLENDSEIMYNGMPGSSYGVFKVGVKFHVD